MRLVPALTLATAASAIVIPQALDEFNHLKSDIKHTLEELPSRIAGSIDEAVEHLSSEISNAVHKKLEDPEVHGHPTEAPIDLLGLDLSDLTIWEILEKSNHTKEFFKLVGKHDKFGKLLNSTDANYTLFAPIDEAFEHIPHDHKPSDEFVESVLNYHLGLGEYPAGRILFTHTLPTALNEPWLGGNPQRLRTSVGFNGVRVNLYSKVVVVNIKAKNGWIHAVNRILVPPPMIGRVISLFPAQFSTLLLAYDKTDFVKYVHNVKMNGSTVFAPSNSAWERLGPKANAFLFNTETGKKYLTALLKYQIVPNTTVYSDEIYYGDEQVYQEDRSKINGNFHIELPTLLEKSLGVDIHTWKSWTSIVVNGNVAVDFEDGIGKNGVIHVVRSVPLPPCRKGGARVTIGGIDVEELKERLQPYVEGEEESEEWDEEEL
ncbi:hypothetical protein LCI18_001736 [Fusarium solani-melongenae]|uniref:Uncharacterized protein n=1 Tax=Fusarium solani subsp. cucurbitae TaxID=2747967 RepID=A0ACD3YQC3_FUSSC|nr:hypothetical protein LCI18_001736 [Fusarium solani-melongenae]